MGESKALQRWQAEGLEQVLAGCWQLAELPEQQALAVLPTGARRAWPRAVTKALPLWEQGAPAEEEVISPQALWPRVSGHLASWLSRGYWRCV